MQTIKVFAASAALTVATAETQLCRSHTVNLEAARRIQGTPHYDWDNKLVLQVSPSEAPDVLAVLAGWKPGVEFQYHGPAKNKGYRLQQQGSHLLIELFSKTAGKLLVPTQPADQLKVLALFFRQFQRNYGGIGTDTLYAMCRDVYSRADNPTSMVSQPARTPNVSQLTV